MTSPIPSTEGKAPFNVPEAGKPCHTWYKILGDLSRPAAVPLIALHGGPGTGHDYLSSLSDLTSQHGVPVVLYDQLGCARSTALPEKRGDRGFWSVELFEAELGNLLRHLGIAEFDLFGHSWGGMLASAYASKQPSGLRKLILMGAPASVALAAEGIAGLRATLSEGARRVLGDHEARGDFDAPAYKEACLEFYNRFVCRLQPWPAEVVRSMGCLEEDPTVYETMYGPSELICTGNLKDWTAIPGLSQIRNTTLVINGEFDEVVDSATAPFFEEIPKAKWITISNSSHMGMWEQRQRLIDILSTFLASSA